MTKRLTASLQIRRPIQCKAIALGLVCALIGSASWAQAAPSNAEATEPAAAVTSTSSKGTKASATAKTSKADKSSSKAQSKSKTKAKSDAQSEAKSDKVVTDKLADAKPVSRTEAPDAAESKPELKPTAKPEAVAKADSKPATQDLAPPPGTMMGAYGQSLMRAPATAPAANTTSTATTVAAAGAATVAAAPVLASAGTPAQPPTVMMGAAGNASESVARFLQQRGLVAQASSVSSAPEAGLLDQVRDRASDLVLSAMNFLGVPYKRGGSSVANGFDCSGFTRHIFEMSVGLVLPRRADEQAKLSSLVKIKREDLKPGDLVFFNTMRQTFSHVGIYVGEGKFIHSPRAGGAVRVEDMREAYWSKRFTGARRADLSQDTPGT